jgi:beta-N-acetylhexosaminidase
MEKDLLILYPAGEQVMLTEDRTSSGGLLVEQVRQRYPRTQARTISLQPTDEEQAQILQQAKYAGITIMLTMNAHLHRQQAVLMQRLLQEKQFVIGIATYNPYDLQAFPELPTYLATYECTPPALEAAVRVLFGEVYPQGRLPVSLPGL